MGKSPKRIAIKLRLYALSWSKTTLCLILETAVCKKFLCINELSSLDVPLHTSASCAKEDGGD